MPTAKSIINKVNAAIKRVGPMSRQSYRRVTTVTAGDTLTGVGITTTDVDTLFDPQPVYEQLTRTQVMYLTTPTKQLVAGDYRFTFPTTQITQASFQAASASIVLKDGNGTEELEIIYIEPAMFGGADVAISVYARSVGH